jgi:hypothetical protein
MDIASWPWLNPIMRSRLLPLCGFLAFAGTLSGQTSEPPSITHQPVGVVAYIGDTVTLTAIVAGSPPIRFQWHRDGAVIAGATNSSFTITPVAWTNMANYHLIATNDFGSVSSLTAPIYVTKRPQTISFNPASTSAVAGSSVVLNAVSSANLPVAFTLVSGAASLNGNILTGSGGNVVVRASQAGNETIAAAEPVERTFSFIAGSLSPFITSPPLDTTVTAGTSVTLRGTAIGTPAPTYQWQKDGISIPGATGASLTLSMTALSDTGRYAITASNAVGVASASAVVTVHAAPTISTAPLDRTVFAGDGASFTVGVTGFPLPTFQWRRNGATVSGATNATLSLASATATDAGRYDVVVTNPLGSVTSVPVTLIVMTRDFSGMYFGQFSGTPGDFALHVRADRTAVFIGHMPGRQTGLAIFDVRVDLTGNFSASTTTLAAAPQPVTVRGALNDTTGTATGTVTGISATFEGIRASRTGTASAYAGLYQAALIGSAAGRGHLLVAADGQALLLTASGAVLDAARGTVDASGRLVATTASQAALEVVLSNGGVVGSVRTPAGTTGTISGAIEGRAGLEHLVNLSVRTVTSPGAATLITGFVVTGTSPKQVLIRAAGPALVPAPFNVTNALADPTLQLFRGNTAIGQNDDWGTPAANVAAIIAAGTRAGAFPFRAGSADAALLTTLQPGPYSVVIGGGTGTALAEIYEVLENNEAIGARRLVNVSARGIVTPATPFIAGFVITGTGPQRVLIRGIGPTLGTPPFNVAGALPNPQLTLFRGSTTMKSNDDWFRDPEATLIRDAASRAGAFALGANSLDAAILLYLEPGAYTAQISGPANATGLALVEVYESTP